MTYATQQDLVDRFGAPELAELTDRAAESTGEIDDTMVTAALEEADAEINSYLAKQVATPINPVPAQVKRIAVDIARYRLHRDNVPDGVRNAYKDAVAWLTRAAAGDVSLGDTAAPTEPATVGEPMIDTGCRTFSHDTLRDF